MQMQQRGMFRQASLLSKTDTALASVERFDDETVVVLKVL